jgi:Prenyltransferase and squalene oxidase repeat
MLMFTRSLRTLSVLAVIVAVSLMGWPASRGAAQDACLADVPAALAWMASLQNPDGGFTNGFQPESDLGTTADTLFAATSAKYDPAQFIKEGKTPLDYLTAQVKANKADKAGLLGKLMLGLAGTDANATAFAARNLIDDTLAALKALEEGSDLYSLSLALLGLHAVGAPLPEAAVKTLLESRNADGGWGFSKGSDSDTNTSALALQALIAAKAPVKTAETLAYFKAAQNEDKGWPYQQPATGSAESDANSTAGVIQALIAAGEALDTWGNPGQLLASFQQADGSFTYQRSQVAPNFLATVQAVPVLCGVTLSGTAEALAATPEATP